MKRTKIGLVILSAVAAIGVATLVPAVQAQRPGQQQEKPLKEQPFQGKVDAVDTSAKTLTVDGRLIYISNNTKLTKTGQTIMLSDIMVGDQVHGMTHETFDGKAEASTVKVGPREGEPEQK